MKIKYGMSILLCMLCSLLLLVIIARSVQCMTLCSMSSELLKLNVGEGKYTPNIVALTIETN